MTVNKVILIGRIGKDPDVRKTDRGTFVTLSLATNESYKDRTGTKVEKTEWHRINFFGKLAEIAEQFLTNGMLIFVHGRLRTSEYEKDGVKHYQTNIVADEMRMLSSKQTAPKPAVQQPVAQPILSAPEDEIPF